MRGSNSFIFDSWLRFICLGFKLFLLNFLQQGIEPVRSHPRMDFALVDHHGRRLGAQPQAVNRLQRHAAIGARAMGLAAQCLLRMGEQCIATTRLAGFGPADLDQRPAMRLLAQMRVIADNTMDLGTRKIQGLGNGGHGSTGMKPSLSCRECSSGSKPPGSWPKRARQCVRASCCSRLSSGADSCGCAIG
jgi:hypothetical protein